MTPVRVAGAAHQRADMRKNLLAGGAASHPCHAEPDGVHLANDVCGVSVSTSRRPGEGARPAGEVDAEFARDSRIDWRPVLGVCLGRLRPPRRAAGETVEARSRLVGVGTGRLSTSSRIRGPGDGHGDRVCRVGVWTGAARIACPRVERGVAEVSRSGLAADLGGVGLVDQIGSTLAVADQPSEQHSAAVTNYVHAGLESRFAHLGLQIVE